MRINLLCVGKTDDQEIRNLISYYIPRLPKHWNFEIIEIQDIKNARNLTPEILKKEEGKLLLQHIENNDWTIILDEKGKQYTSREFATKLENLMNASVKKINLIIGNIM